MSDPTRILVADDHPMFRRGVAESLNMDPEFKIIGEAESGEQAVAMTLQLRPDLVMLDISMPGIDGIVAASRIAASLPEVRIVMLTVAENQKSLLAALKAGAHGYVLKGVSAFELRSIVRRVADGEAYVTPHLAASMLRDFSRPSVKKSGISELTPREAEVLDLLSQGLTNRQIGECLSMAEKTVKHHMTSILQKLQVRTRTEAAILVLQRSAAAGPAEES